jgi:predicted HicB family RNase H-like nuclease
LREELMAKPEETRDTDSARTIIVRLKPETHKALRIKVAEEDTSIQKWVEELIERELGVGQPGSKAGSGKRKAKK